MGLIHKYRMHCCKKQSVDFIYCCCWAVIVRYVVGPSLFTDSTLVSKTVFKNVCVAGMAVRLNMSLASLCSHVHKSTYNDCKPKTHRPEKSAAASLRPHLRLRTSRRRSSHVVPICHRLQRYGWIALLLLRNKRSVVVLVTCSENAALT